MNNLLLRKRKNKENIKTINFSEKILTITKQSSLKMLENGVNKHWNHSYHSR